MLGKAKKTVNEEYKKKLLSEIAYYEKRIEETLRQPKPIFFEDAESDEEQPPYKVDNGPSRYELKRQEQTLVNRTNMTLELAMLTILHSEVNVMVKDPEVRRPIKEGGTWREVTAKCRIDLVPFIITFYVHKPNRRFAPSRYRNVSVTMGKEAQQKELEQSVLGIMNRPHLALQVLQSYATGFRSRRTTLLSLAEKYDDKLRMEPLSSGGFCVSFLDLIKVEWTLENQWSPVVPFYHRMKFEVEYMPRTYIHTISKLYKQFKDPSLETSDRTYVLDKMFDTCLEAAGEMGDRSDDGAGVHERSTTIDEEPEAPDVVVSPKKQPKGKENRVQNDKAIALSRSKRNDEEIMAPPKTLPKKGVKRSVRSDDNHAKRVRVDKDNDSDKRDDVGIGNNDKTKDKRSERSGGNAKRVREDNNSEKGDAGVTNNDKTNNSRSVRSEGNAKRVREDNDCEKRDVGIGNNDKRNKARSDGNAKIVREDNDSEKRDAGIGNNDKKKNTRGERSDGNAKRVRDDNDSEKRGVGIGNNDKTNDTRSVRSDDNHAKRVRVDKDNDSEKRNDVGFTNNEKNNSVKQKDVSKGEKIQQKLVEIGKVKKSVNDKFKIAGQNNLNVGERNTNGNKVSDKQEKVRNDKKNNLNDKRSEIIEKVTENKQNKMKDKNIHNNDKKSVQENLKAKVTKVGNNVKIDKKNDKPLLINNKKDAENNEVLNKNDTKVTNKDENDKTKNSKFNTVNKLAKDKSAEPKTVNQNTERVIQVKTKIPVIKKPKISNFKDIKQNNRISKGVEKTKIPKKLPIFKKVTNVPTRISPRKLPLSVKSAMQEYRRTFSK